MAGEESAFAFPITGSRAISAITLADKET